MLVNRRLFLVAAMLLLAASGCRKTWLLRPVRAVSVDGAVVLEALDGSFTIAGEMRETPFHGGCLVAPNSSNFADARRARPVRVKVPGRSAPLYGLLGFCGVAEGARGPVSRSYLISVPQRYIDETTGGRISVVYEQYDAPAGWPREFPIPPAWTLWLAERPVFGGAAPAAAQAEAP